MIQGKKVISILLTLALCFGMVAQVQASELSDTRQKAKELEEKKNAAEAEKKSLATQMETLVAEMEEMKTQIDAKEAELEVKEEELYEAQAKENDQYESMKKRIKYMYENGNTQFIEILCASKDISEFLNNAEYITTISEYDRDQLKEYQAVREAVQKQQEALEAEYAELETLQNGLIEKQGTLETLLASKESEISSIASELSDTTKKLSQLEAAAAEAARKQQEKDNVYSSGAGGSVVSGNGTLTHPCPGYTRISSGFGWRPQPLPGASTNHKGIDFAAPTGTPIYAAAGGTVTSAGYSGNAGKMIVINHGNGMLTYYMHCNTLYVKPGQKVSKGQNIAAVGTTGNSTGPHLHFQVTVNGTPVNPMKYF